MKRDAFVKSIDLSSRRKRRAAANLAISLIDRIHHEEFLYMQRIPFNLRASAAYDAAEDSPDWLVAAMSAIAYAYDCF